MASTRGESLADLSTLLDPATCVEKGLCPVTKIRGQSQNPLESHTLYYEIHGSGPEKLVFISGMSASLTGWQYQVEHFARLPKYSVLVFDNRGAGNSSTPRGPYTTSGMAEDAIVLLNYVGWKRRRDLHIVGGSMGGMIAQELAARIPERIVSLVLAVTTPGGHLWNNLPPWKGLCAIVKLMKISDLDEKISLLLDTNFPKAWLDLPAEGDDNRLTNRDVQREMYKKRLPIIRPQSLMGVLSHNWAPLFHYVSPTRLRYISSTIPKIIILTGDNDNLIEPRHSFELKESMPEAEFVQWETTGHAIHTQWPRRLSALIERAIREGRAKGGPSTSAGLDHVF